MSRGLGDVYKRQDTTTGFDGIAGTEVRGDLPVSYTHLTLPTKLEV
ncbi:hypothetical protein JMUB7533_26900 [Staphylococcus aureus]